MTEHHTPTAGASPDLSGEARRLAWQRLLRIARRTLPVIVPLAAVLLIWHDLHRLDMHQLRACVARADRGMLALAGVGAVLAVVSMGLYDAIALQGLTFGKRWRIGAVCFAWTNFLTIGPLGGPAARFFLYRQAGVAADTIAIRLARLYLGVWAGAGGVLLAALVPMPGGWTWAAVRVALAALLAPLAVVGAGAVIGRWKPAWVPTHRESAAMGLVAALEWSLAGTAFILAARSLGIDLPPGELARSMMLGHGAGLLSMVPGGLGTADATWLSLETLGGVSPSDAAAHILLYRGLFYLLPWSISLIALYVVLVRRSARTERWLRRVLAGALLVNAVLLLASAATPAVRARLHAMQEWMPVGVFDASHSIAVVAAAWMLFLLRGVLRGYRSAAIIVSFLLLTSAISHTLKGGDVEEATACVVLLILLLGAMHSFRRRGRVPIGWELAVAAACGSVAFFLVVGLASFEKVPYTADLWTRFGPKAEASRMLRGTVLVGLVGLAFLIRQAVRPAREWVVAGPEEIGEAVRTIAASDGSPSALGVGVGDKGVWKSSAGGLLTYQRARDKMIVYADPVVPGQGESELLTELLAYTEVEDFDLVFYEVSARWLGPLHEFGFSFFKLGEEAVVPIEGFAMAGGPWAGMRQIVRKVEKAGFRFEVREPPHAPVLVDQARDVSDTWLRQKDAREMQFSLGHFSPAYLQRFPLACVFDPSDRLVAFLNLLETRTDAELDFMRYETGLTDNIMDYCIGKAMVWAGERGRVRFSLGMAPLSDVGTHRRSRATERGARLIYQHAERVYNYRGLKAYKEKFHPVWEPRYLAYQGPWALADSLVTVSRLIRAGDRASRARIAAARLGG